MSVLIISNNFPPLYDGVGDYSNILYQQIKQKGFRTIVATRYQEDIQINHAANPDIFSSIPNWNLSGCRRIYKLIKSKEIKHVLLQYVPYAFSTTGLPVSLLFLVCVLRIKGVKVHTNFHEIGIRLSGANLINKIRSLLQRIFAYIFCTLSNSIQTSNAYYASLLAPYNCSIIPIPSNFEFENLDEIENKLSETIIAVNANRCLPFFFESIGLLKQTLQKGLKVYILGRADDAELSKIKALVDLYNLKDEVEYTVHQPAKILLTILKQAAVFVQLEKVNRNGNGGVSSKSGTTATALYLGLPIITTKGDLTDLNLFKEDINLVFVPYNEPKRIAKAIYQLIENKSFHSSLCSEAKNTYSNSFAWKYTLNHFYKLIGN